MIEPNKEKKVMEMVDKKYMINLEYTYNDLLDLHSVLTAVDGYYTPYGSNASRVQYELYRIVYDLLEEIDNELVNSNNRRNTEGAPQ